MAMPTSDLQTAERPPDAARTDAVRFAYEWLDQVRPLVPEAPEAAVTCYFTAMTETDAPPSVDDLGEAMACDPTIAASWLDYLRPRLCHPAAYWMYFEAFEALARHRQQVGTFQQRVEAVAQRLAALEAEIVALDRLGDVSPEHRADVAAPLLTLKAERRELLTSQERELPAQAALYAREAAEVTQGLEDAQGALVTAQQEHLHAVEQTWLAEALAAVQPVLASSVQRLRYVDAALLQGGEQPSRECGSGLLVERLVQLVRAIHQGGA